MMMTEKLLFGRFEIMVILLYSTSNVNTNIFFALQTYVKIVYSNNNIMYCINVIISRLYYLLVHENTLKYFQKKENLFLIALHVIFRYGSKTHVLILHSVISRSTATFRANPVNILTVIFYVTGFAMNAILSIYHQSITIDSIFSWYISKAKSKLEYFN